MGLVEGVKLQYTMPQESNTVCQDSPTESTSATLEELMAQMKSM